MFQELSLGCIVKGFSRIRKKGILVKTTAPCHSLSFAVVSWLSLSFVVIRCIARCSLSLYVSLVCLFIKNIHERQVLCTAPVSYAIIFQIHTELLLHVHLSLLRDRLRNI